MLTGHFTKRASRESSKQAKHKKSEPKYDCMYQGAQSKMAVISEPTNANTWFLNWCYQSVQVTLPFHALSNYYNLCAIEDVLEDNFAQTFPQMPFQKHCEVAT